SGAAVPGGRSRGPAAGRRRGGAAADGLLGRCAGAAPYGGAGSSRRGGAGGGRPGPRRRGPAGPRRRGGAGRGSVGGRPGRAAAMAAEGRVRAERRARRMTIGLAASVLIAGALGAGGWTWVERDRMARVTARTTLVSTALQEATGHRVRAKAAQVPDLVVWT